MPLSYYCTTCDAAVITVVFAADYKSISITFADNVHLSGVQNETIYQSGSCVKLFDSATLATLGDGVQCRWQHNNINNIFHLLNKKRNKYDIY